MWMNCSGRFGSIGVRSRVKALALSDALGGMKALDPCREGHEVDGGGGVDRPREAIDGDGDGDGGRSDGDGHGGGGRSDGDGQGGGGCGGRSDGDGGIGRGDGEVAVRGGEGEGADV